MSLLDFQPTNCVAMLPVHWDANGARDHIAELDWTIAVLIEMSRVAIDHLRSEEPDAALATIEMVLREIASMARTH